MPPSDYYIKINAAGQHCYFLTLTGKSIAKGRIPKGYLQGIEIKPWSYVPETLEKRELLTKKNHHEYRLLKMKIEMEEIEKELQRINLRLLELPKGVPPKGVDVLQWFNITTKVSFQQWLKQNHPDKGGDNELCASVIAAWKAKQR